MNIENYMPYIFFAIEIVNYYYLQVFHKV